MECGAGQSLCRQLLRFYVKYHMDCVGDGSAACRVSFSPEWCHGRNICFRSKGVANSPSAPTRSPVFQLESSRALKHGART
mmetsp:Transcript_736/g.2147  ORF Transcript_736/g.2147 Transcript_736/m.2147 type:complete len:81 (-) Transcript_736:500-742(-)